MFEEQIERRKIEMLRTVTAGRGGGPPPVTPERGGGS
jgi:hypothetical protein